jgi:methionine-R-sulfoxide reductase
MMGFDPIHFRKPAPEELAKLLTPLQLQVTQEGDDEPPYENEYWNNQADGLYVDRISGEPLFGSREKYEANCGWASFVKPLDDGNVVKKIESRFHESRIEVRSRHSGAHLGHVFDDGPPERGGLRYSINSASMRFIPKERLEAEGYGNYLRLFDER